MQEITEIIQAYGIDAVALALAVNLLTGLVKIPIKRLALRLEPKGIFLKKYITLLPVAIGFGLSALVTGLYLEPGVFWNDRTPVLAVTASSLSLSLYAICEKFFAGKPLAKAESRDGEKPLAKAEPCDMEKPLAKTESCDMEKPVAEGSPDETEESEARTAGANELLCGGEKIVLKRKEEESESED